MNYDQGMTRRNEEQGRKSRRRGQRDGRACLLGALNKSGNVERKITVVALHVM
jgi:hypothetical protein